MTKAIPFGDWLDEQGDDVRLAMCEGHPETLILVDTTNMGVYKYVVAESQDGVREVTELARWMYQVMDESCATHYPYEPTPVSIHALMRAEQKLRALGIEV